MLLMVFLLCGHTVHGSNLTIYSLVYFGKKQDVSSEYTDLVSVYNYSNYAESVEGLFIDKKRTFVIQSDDIVSASIEDVWFKPDDLLLYQVAIKIKKSLSNKVAEFLSGNKKIAFVINGAVFTISEVIKPVHIDDATIVVSVLGRGKKQIKQELLEITNNVVIQ